MVINFLGGIQQKLNVVRTNEWWYFKGAPVLGTIYVACAMLDLSALQIWQLLIFIVFSLTITAIYAHLLNDFSDREDDLACGKKNMMLNRSSLFIVTLFASCIVPAIIITYFLLPSPSTTIVYLSMWLVFSAYSLPPLRLKTKGIWGVLADAMGAHLLPQLFAVCTIVFWTQKTLPLLWIIALSIWSLTAGIRGIFWHQIQDLENDRNSGVETFATRYSPESLQLLAKWLIFPTEIIAFTTLLLLSNNIVAWVFLGFYFVSKWLRGKDSPLKIVIVTSDKKNDRLTMYKYYEAIYPLAFLVQLSWHNPINLLLLGFHLILYPQRFWYWLQSLTNLSRWTKLAKLSQS